MIAYCNYIPDTTWVREVKNGIRRVTLRRDFTEELVEREEGNETQFRFEEVDVRIPDRENIQEFIDQNFDSLFELGLQQTIDNYEKEKKIQELKRMMQDGSVVDDLAMIRGAIDFIIMNF